MWASYCCYVVCRSQATPTTQQATPSSHQSTPTHSSLLPLAEVVLPLHISHVVLCEGIGRRALEQAISFLYSGTVDISEGSLVCLGIGLCMEVCVTLDAYNRYVQCGDIIQKASVCNNRCAQCVSVRLLCIHTLG